MSPILPFIEVSHLPSSSSFYSAATQPLGLRYIPAANSSGSSSITYGIVTSPPVPVFELRQVRPSPSRPLKRSRVVFSASSPEAVRDFQVLVRRVKEDLRNKSARPGPVADSDDFLAGTAAGKGRNGYESARLPDKARETDIDGNIIEVTYMPQADHSDRYGGSAARKTQSTQSEVGRILNWNYNVASTEPAAGVSLAPLAPASSTLANPRRPGRFADGEQAPGPRRNVSHTSATMYEQADPTTSPRQSSTGFLGTGAMRSPIPEPYHDIRGRHPDYERPAKESVADRRPPTAILTRYTSHGQVPLAGRSREVDDVRHSSRAKPLGASAVRARSENATNRKPLVPADMEHRGYFNTKHSDLEDVAQDHRGHVSSRHPAQPRHGAAEPQHSIRRSHTYHVGAGGDSYMSRTQRTMNTIRSPPPAGAQADLGSRPPPKQTGRVFAAAPQDKPRRSNSYASARDVTRDVPLAGSRTVSYMSGREAPLPAGRMGMSYVPARHASGSGGPAAHHSAEQWDDDVDSIAPSDSISCVGARRAERAYR